MSTSMINAYSTTNPNINKTQDNTNNSGGAQYGSQQNLNSKNKKRVHLRTTSCQKQNLSNTKPESKNTSMIGNSEIRNNSKERNNTKNNFISPKVNGKENKLISGSKYLKPRESIQNQSKKEQKHCQDNYFNSNLIVGSSKNNSSKHYADSKFNRSKLMQNYNIKTNLDKKYVS